MKRIAAFIFAILLLFSNALADIDLSSMTLEELNALKRQINLEIASRPDVKSVTVPEGVWEIGKDIPAGEWDISADKNQAVEFIFVIYTNKLDATGKKSALSAQDHLSMLTASNNDLVTYTLKNGMYIIITNGNAIFTPSNGKPDLGFDW